jgi:hypothetical protein
VSTTTRLGLEKPEATDEYDIAVYNDNWDKLDLAAGTIICSSSTRPSTGLFVGLTIFEIDTNRTYYWDGDSWEIKPATGVLVICTSGDRPSTPVFGTPIYETDTGRQYYYNGTDWVPYGRYTVGGKRYTTTSATTSNITTVETAIYDTGSQPLVNGRIYMLRTRIEFQNSAANDVVLKIRDTNASGTILGSLTATPKGAATSTVVDIEVPYPATTTGNKTFVVTAIRATGTGNVTGRGNSASPPYALVEHIGPSGILTSV